MAPTRRQLQRKRQAMAALRATESTQSSEMRRERVRLATQLRRQKEREVPQDSTGRCSNVAVESSTSLFLPWREKTECVFYYNPQLDYNSDPSVSIGSMNFVCPYCKALKWEKEAPGLCCNNGKVQVQDLNDAPDTLLSLLCGDNSDALHFQKYIRHYNSCFQMTSFGCNRIVGEGYMPTFKIQGQVYHRIGSLLPDSNDNHKFLQIYFISDSNNQVERRCNITDQVRPSIIRNLQFMLHQHNKYIKDLKCSLENVSSDHNIVIKADKTISNHHPRRYNAPEVSEVAIVLVGEEHGNRDIVLKVRDNSLQRISETHRSYDALQYPLIFWQGDDGYHFCLNEIDPLTKRPTCKKMSANSFYCYKFMLRNGKRNLLFRYKDLFQQYAVDMFAKIISERLLYLRLNQEKLRADSYVNLRDAIITDGNAENVGQRVVLPSTFTGGPRYMHERTQDAMCYVRKYGRPDLFLTFTCNPKWAEISKELMENQKPSDRPDIVARVFHLKLNILMKLIRKYNIFGDVRCEMFTIEWQKRGLPHSHILLWLNNKINANRIDSCISAEIPDQQNDPALFSIVTSNMIHGPCGSLNPACVCMKNNSCTKNFPKRFVKETQTDVDGYPIYRRRSPEDGGNIASIKLGSRNIDIDNRWVVPYCPVLLRIFNAHINVEYCHSVKSIKYVCKYINKGHDMAVIGVSTETSKDEITNYEVGRYISSGEAFWRIFNFPIHERNPAVIHLNIHLENGQRVYFTEANAHQRSAVPPVTTLTAFFKLCQEDSFAKTLLYDQVPTYYTWQNKTWVRRKQGQDVPDFPGLKMGSAIGRVYSVHPNNAECFYLRMLLHEVRGPTSFRYLRTVNNQECETYRQACQVRGLLEDDNHWNITLEEASSTKSPSMLRMLFAVMLRVCDISNPLHLWNTHKQNLSEDILFNLRHHNRFLEIDFSDIVYNSALILIEDIVYKMGGEPLKAYGLPEPTRNDSQTLSGEYTAELSYNIDQLRKFLLDNEQKLTADQRTIYCEITKVICDGTGGVFFIDAPGGTGKTFLLNLLLSFVRARGWIALAVASSGIAATLLEGGRTAHSAFKLPINISEEAVCHISRGSAKAKLLQESRLIVWDECTMAHRFSLEALDKSMQDLRKSVNIMGGVALILAGDFRQTLPVIPRGTKSDEIQACLRSSYIWQHVQIFRLNQNMRVFLHNDASGQKFATDLLDLGNGKILQDDTGKVNLHHISNIATDIHNLLNCIYPDIETNFSDTKWITERIILAPKNCDVETVNLELLKRIPGEIVVYKSIDSTVDAEDIVNYPTEFLNSLEISGLPQHLLSLKCGAPIICLRNLNPPLLCNGTRLVVKRLHKFLLEAQIITGKGAGLNVFIPRIPIIPSDFPFKFKRLQFPIKLSFAMTINKSQGQTLKFVGLDLRNPCFSHGQLYVGASRVGRSENLYVLCQEGSTVNVVYKEVIQNL